MAADKGLLWITFYGVVIGTHHINQDFSGPANPCSGPVPISKQLTIAPSNKPDEHHECFVVDAVYASTAMLIA